MRILSIKQPWATLIVLRRKSVENRVWTTSYRGLVLVHASRRPDTHHEAIDALRRCLPTTQMKSLPFGQIIGVVEIYDVIAIGDPVKPSDREWFHGPFGLLLRNAHRFSKGVPHAGQLGLVECSPKIERLVFPLLKELGIRPGEQPAEVEHDKHSRRIARNRG